MSNILFFDTETTDLPKFKLPLNHQTQPKILQIAALLISTEGEEITSYCEYVQIGDAPINKYALAAHGISSEKANNEGVLPEEAFERFYEMSFNSSDALACHNFNFDIQLIKYLAHQISPYYDDPTEPLIKLDEILELPYYCTMAKTTSYCKLPFPSGRKGFKFPKLEELHRLLFNEDFEGAHDALADVRATARCYYELKSRGIM